MNKRKCIKETMLFCFCIPAFLSESEEATMNAFVILSVLVASCYAGYDKKHGGGTYPLPLPGGQKPGTCPYTSESGSLGNYCYNDYQCPGQQKCCYVYYSAIRRCQVPQELQRPGFCPAYYYGQVFGYCNTDWQCPYGYKCCSGANGGVNTCRIAQYGFGPFQGVGGQFPGGVGSFPGVGGQFPGVGGPFPGVGGPFPGVGGPFPGVGGPFPGVGGNFPSVSPYPGVGVYPALKKKVY